MAYVWQSSITSGTVILDEFYFSIQDTYNEVINNHCPSNYTGVNSDKAQNSDDSYSSNSSNYSSVNKTNYGD